MSTRSTVEPLISDLGIIDHVNREFFPKKHFLAQYNYLENSLQYNSYCRSRAWILIAADDGITICGFRGTSFKHLLQHFISKLKLNLKILLCFKMVAL